MSSERDTISLDSQVESPSDSEQFDLSTYVAARIFNDAALPPGTPDRLKALIDEQASFAQRLPGTAEWTIGGAGGGSLGVKSKEERKAEVAKESIELMRTVVEQAEREQERLRWDEDMHSFAQVTMSGAEWSQLGDDLHDDSELRRWLVERLKRDGRSADDAETKADEIADVATIMGKPESERTAAERAKMDKAKDDPAFTKIMAELNEQRLNGPDRLEPSAGSDRNARISAYADRSSLNPDAADPHRSALGTTATASMPLTPAAAPSIPASPIPAASAGLNL